MVYVDGVLADRDNLNVDASLQTIMVSGKELEHAPEVYYLMNKPSGVVSARKDKEHQTVIDLIRPEDRREGLYPVGRLDRDTEGLVLITNNGPLGFAMLHPRYRVTISEGKFHQVKKMFLAYGVKVTYLKRISFGEFKLDEGMAVGSYRTLTEAEKTILRTYLG